MRKLLAKNIGFPLQDLMRKTSILNTLDFLRESQYWDEDKLHTYRLLKLRQLVKFASKNVPYYENLFQKTKLKPNDLRFLSDIEKIPILAKETARKENYNLIARNFRMRYVKKGKTGGTTGTPLIIYKDVFNRTFTWASYYRWYDWMGLEMGDNVATLWGTSSVLHASIVNKKIKAVSNYLQNHSEFNAFEMTDQNMYRIFKVMSKTQPVLLKGYLSAILKFAGFVESNELSGFRPNYIGTTSETLLPSHRLYLSRVFNSQIFDQYGCGELSAISYECNRHQGLHINTEHIILETIDSNQNTVIDETGNIVGTDLDNYVMPFIRYANDDKATIFDKKCGCGVNQPLMTSIEGRSADTLILKNGSHVHGVFLTDIFYELGIFANRIQRFQAVQYSNGEILLKLESKAAIDKKALKNLRNSLHKFFWKVEIETVDEIPIEKTGKFKYIKNLTSVEN